jgi:putative FmdB family regulatory protein
MPTYQYQCEPCESTVTQVVSINQESKTPKCLKCNKDMARVFSVPSLSFKGGGWAHKE